MNIIKEKSFDNILALPKSVLYQNYISTVSNIKYFNLFLDFKEIKNNNLKKFAILCLYKPRFVVMKKLIITNIVIKNMQDLKTLRKFMF